MDTKPPKKSPRLVLDENGDPIKNKFGHNVTAPLNEEEKAAIDKLAAKGYSRKAIAEEVGVSITRLKNYLEEPKVAERIALLAYTQEQAAHNAKMDAMLSSLVDIVAKLESRVSDMQSQIREVKKATYRQKIGREAVERTKRSQRQELTQLRNRYWKRTGQKH